MQPGMNWSGESPWQRLRRRKAEVLAEALELVEALAQELQVWKEERSSSSSWEENGFGVAERWESAETVREVVGLCVEIVRANDPLAAHNLCRQLRRWRQENGRADRGWIEVRVVKGYGPYVYYRWREIGSREIRTE